MGINKSNIRAIVHHTPPISLHHYSQECGRAGRDGKPSRCIIFPSANYWLHRKFIENKNPYFGDIKKVFEFLKKAAPIGDLIHLTGKDIADESNVSEYAIATIKNILRWSGHIETHRQNERRMEVKVNKGLGAPQGKALTRTFALIKANGDPIGDATYEIDPFDIASDAGVRVETIMGNLRSLQRAQHVSFTDPYRGSVTVVHKEILALDVDELNEKRKREIAKFDAMIEFMGLPDNETKHKFLVNHFAKVGSGKDYPLPERVKEKVVPAVEAEEEETISEAEVKETRQEVASILSRELDSNDPAWKPKRMKKIFNLLKQVDDFVPSVKDQVIEGGF